MVPVISALLYTVLSYAIKILACDRRGHAKTGFCLRVLFVEVFVETTGLIKFI